MIDALDEVKWEFLLCYVIFVNKCVPFLCIGIGNKEHPMDLTYTRLWGGG